MKATIDLWACIDANGDYGVGSDADSAKEDYGNAVGDLPDADGFRLVRVQVKVPLPAVIEAAAEVADDETAEATAA